MKRKFNKDALILAKLQRIISDKPPLEKMIEDIRMMKFKIRPLQGDISQINFQDSRLIDILWSLGKLDEYYHQEYKNISSQNKSLFFKYFEDINVILQKRLNKLNLHQEKPAGSASIMEMEIFRERPLKKNIN